MPGTVKHIENQGRRGHTSKGRASVLIVKLSIDLYCSETLSKKGAIAAGGA